MRAQGKTKSGVSLRKRVFPHQIGLITTPLDFDPLPSDLARWIGPDLGIAHRNLIVENYNFELEDRRRGFSQIPIEARNLAALGVDVVGQNGTNWVHCQQKLPDELRAFCDGLSDEIGVPFHMSGLCILEAAKRFGWYKWAVSNGYYPSSWKHGVNAFFEADGIEIASCGSFQDFGLIDPAMVRGDILVAPPIEFCLASMEAALKNAPDADVVVMTSVPNWKRTDGTTQRSFAFARELEDALGKPVITSEIALFYYVLESSGVRPPEGHGALLDSLA